MKSNSYDVLAAYQFLFQRLWSAATIDAAQASRDLADL
jgi:hypothetical protein